MHSHTNDLHSKIPHKLNTGVRAHHGAVPRQPPSGIFHRLERLARLLRADELVGALIKFIHRVERVGAFQLAEVIIDHLENVFAPIGPNRLDQKELEKKFQRL